MLTHQKTNNKIAHYFRVHLRWSKMCFPSVFLPNSCVNISDVGRLLYPSRKYSTKKNQINHQILHHELFHSSVLVYFSP